jgi:hypothetical protein
VRLATALLLLGALSGSARADDMMDMGGALGANPSHREASGTSWQPDATPMEGLHQMLGAWTLMAHGWADLVYDRQGGPRGGEKLFSSSMGMVRAQRDLGPGRLGLRAMLSLDPLMGPSGYPLLLQTGETSNGREPLVDRQHPHDLFMELAATYSWQASQDLSLFAYGGLPGEPALGPPVYMHRFSGQDLPQAPLSHHWLDSTHVAFGVVTGGLVWKDWKLDASGFRGREPDRYRWDIEQPRLDSWSARLSWNPTERWAVQASGGRLHSPEQLEPEVDQDRVTASVLRAGDYEGEPWQWTLAWGRDMNRPGKELDAWLFELASRRSRHHTLLARVEEVKKDELFAEGEPQFGRAFWVTALTAGYLYEWDALGRIAPGVGASITVDALPDALHAAYGRAPVSVMFWARARLL